ncbi:MAG: hypothetical protein ACTSXO_03765 [Candidatus Heimdallarchaeota archaeon]
MIIQKTISRQTTMLWCWQTMEGVMQAFVMTIMPHILTMTTLLTIIIPLITVSLAGWALTKRQKKRL